MTDSHPIPTTHLFQDLTGRVFGHLTVLSFAGVDKHHNARWLCRCECGGTKTAIQLTRGRTKSCGKCLSRMPDEEYELMVKQRILASILKSENGCWEWAKCRGPKGYSQLKMRGRMVRVHVMSYRAFRGPVPKGLHVLHTCDNPRCVNPDHLFLGTNQDNVDDKVAKGRQAHVGGEANGQSKLTQEKVDSIRKLFATGGMSQGQLARHFGISASNVSAIIRRKSWKN